MIKYRLVCKNCSLSFDSWFASSNEFEKLKKKNYLNCHKCNSTKVEKTLMAPKTIKINNHLRIGNQRKELKVLSLTMRKLCPLIFSIYILNHIEYHY